MELTAYFFPVMKAIAIVLVIRPAAFPIVRRSKYRQIIFKAALFIYAGALLIAIGLTILWFLGFKLPS